MIKKKILNVSRVRSIKDGFSFIPHHFLTGGFWSALNPNELLLYFFLVLAGDRNGLSFYSYIIIEFKYYQTIEGPLCQGTNGSIPSIIIRDTYESVPTCHL